jgi:hypothetical protein
VRIWFEGNAIACRPTPQLGRHVASLRWNRHRRRITGRLEYRAEQNRGVGNCSAVTFGEPFDLQIGEIAEGAAIVEEKLHFRVHVWLQLDFSQIAHRFAICCEIAV